MDDEAAYAPGRFPVFIWLPGDARVLVASACSGHGFKHSAGLGEAVAENIVNDGSGFAAFGAGRLGVLAFSAI